MSVVIQATAQAILDPGGKRMLFGRGFPRGTRDRIFCKRDGDRLGHLP